MKTLPLPKADPTTGVLDWTEFDAAVKTALANWPDAQAAILEAIALKGDSMKQGDIKTITADLKLINDIYTKSEAGTWQPGERGKFIVDVIFASADAIVATLQAFAPNLAGQLIQYIPFLLGTGITV